MFDDDQDESQSISARVANADSTRNLINAIQVLSEKDFSLMMGSGLVVSITDMKGDYVCPEFLMRAEAMQEIKTLFVSTLREQLKFRKALKDAVIELRSSEVRDIEKCLE